MSAVISEDHFKQILSQELTELGYPYVNGVTISPDGMYAERTFQKVVSKER